jgi:putative glutamine amidotransferase
MKPLVGISCCSKIFGPNGLPNHAASDFCVRAVSRISGAVPVLLPATGEPADFTALLRRLDGILLTGSRSHIQPCTYGGPAPAAGTPQDRARDATTLPLIRAAIARGTPILAICRGCRSSTSPSAARCTRICSICPAASTTRRRYRRMPSAGSARPIRSS